MLRVISFDIDGTLECGHPPGLIPLSIVRQAKALGWIVGSCSDWPISAQRALWVEHDIPVDFAVGKPGLENVRVEMAADSYVHIGDTEIDRMYAVRAQFDFRHVNDDGLEEWLQELGLTHFD